MSGVACRDVLDQADFNALSCYLGPFHNDNGMYSIANAVMDRPDDVDQVDEAEACRWVLGNCRLISDQESIHISRLVESMICLPMTTSIRPNQAYPHTRMGLVSL